jgi:hypothetical protein
MTIDIRKFRVGDTVTIHGTIAAPPKTEGVGVHIKHANGDSWGIFVAPKTIATHTPKSWTIGDIARAVPKLGPRRVMNWPKVKIMALNEQGWAWVKALEEDDAQPFTVNTADLERI